MPQKRRRNLYGYRLGKPFQASLPIVSITNLKTQTKERNDLTGGEDSATSEPYDHQTRIQYWSWLAVVLPGCGVMGACPAPDEERS